MGRVSIWAQWLIIAAGVLLSPMLVVLLVLLFARAMWPAAPSQAAGAPAAREPRQLATDRIGLGNGGCS
jgi:hypothetical protein